MAGETKGKPKKGEATKKEKTAKVPVPETDEPMDDDEDGTSESTSGEEEVTVEDTEETSKKGKAKKTTKKATPLPEHGESVDGGNKERIRIGTWNVRTLLQGTVKHGAEKSLLNLLCIMDCNSIDILGVSETTWRGESYMKYTIFGQDGRTEKQYHIFYSGTETPKGKGASYGVAVILSPRVYSRTRTRYRFNTTKTKPLHMKPQCKKNMMAIDLDHLGIQVTQIYAPACTEKEEEKKREQIHSEFATELSQLIGKDPPTEMSRVVMGDFNEKETTDPIRKFCLNQMLHVVKTTKKSEIDDIYAPDQENWKEVPNLRTGVCVDHDLICIETQVCVPPLKQEHNHALPGNDEIQRDGFGFYDQERERERKRKRKACMKIYGVLSGYKNLLMEE